MKPTGTWTPQKKTGNPNLDGPLWTPSWKGTPVKSKAPFRGNLTKGSGARRAKVAKVLKKKGLPTNYR